MISSGFGSLEELKARNFERLFPGWNRTIFPHDFMSYDPERKQLIWYYALTGNAGIDPGEFEIIDYEGGLYAAGVSVDEDDGDGTRVYNGIREWIEASGRFELDERPGHYTLFHVTTSPAAKKALGYNQLDIFVPVRAINGGGRQF